MPTEFAALVAIDWADQKHVWALQRVGSSERETGTLDHTPEAVEVWASELRLRFGGQPVAVALEQCRGPLVFTLTKYDHLVSFRFTLRRWRIIEKAFAPRGPRTILVMPDSSWIS